MTLPQIRKYRSNLSRQCQKIWLQTNFTPTGSKFTQLTWSAVNDAMVAGYHIYSRRDDEPFLKLLTDVASGTTQFQIDHPWNEPLRLYAISAFDTSGNESFLSNIITNRISTVTNFYAQTVNGQAPLTVQFTDASSGEINSWLWDFGDGQTSTEQNPTHTYEAAGVFSGTINRQ